MNPPISEYIHYWFEKRLKIINVKTILDIGGVGKMKNRGFVVNDANKRQGLDGTHLPFDDESFDVTMSIAVLEHVGDFDSQAAFMRESYRIAKYISLHWIPIHEGVENFLKTLGHQHSCMIPNYHLLLNTLKIKAIVRPSFTTIKEHLLLLATMNPKLNKPELYDYIYKHGDETYAIILELYK